MWVHVRRRKTLGHHAHVTKHRPHKKNRTIHHLAHGIQHHRHSTGRRATTVGAARGKVAGRRHKAVAQVGTVRKTKRGSHFATHRRKR